MPMCEQLKKYVFILQQILGLETTAEGLNQGLQLDLGSRTIELGLLLTKVLVCFNGPRPHCNSKLIQLSSKSGQIHQPMLYYDVTYRISFF